MTTACKTFTRKTYKRITIKTNGIIRGTEYQSINQSIYLVT